MNKLLDGNTDNGERVMMLEDAHGLRIMVDGEELRVKRVDTFRDGGTKTYSLDGGRELTFPHRVGDPDRTPKLDGLDVKPWMS